MKKIKIKKLRDIPLPEYNHPGDSGMDLINAGEDTIIAPGKRALIPAGIKVAVPEGLEIQIRSRSGLAIKDGLMVLNSPGTIDAGYRGEIGVILLNTSEKSVTVPGGMRIAQAVLQKIEKISWDETDTLDDSSRGDGGFGSTGKD
ncbi:MAG: dUTP diphosphatase [Elusimicrobia bacterium]|nr:dUTP diphosphatase [Elusimicrobiota bacterium]